MNKIRNAVLRWWMCCKRFLKKKIFVLLLLAIPVLMLCLKNVSKQETGMLKVVLCAEQKTKEEEEWLKERFSGESIIRYLWVEDEEAARGMVIAGEVDEAWIFAPDFLGKVKELAWNGSGDIPVSVTVSENTVTGQMARLQLFAALYPEISYSCYENFVYEELGLTKLSQTELQKYYEEGLTDSVKISQVYEETVSKESNYLTAPFRGLLSLVILLAGLAANMFFMQDEENGVLDGIPLRQRQGRMYLYQAVAMFLVASAVLLALWVSGEMEVRVEEFAAMALYVADSMVFCTLLKRICGKVHRMGAVIPVLMLVMFVICPVFVTIRSLRLLQYLFPPFYYLNAVHGTAFSVYGKMMLAYGVAGFLFHEIWNRRRLDR